MTDIHETLAILGDNDGTTRRGEFPYLFDPRHLARGFRRLAEGAETAVLELLDAPTRTEVKRIEVEAEARLGAVAGYGEDGSPDEDYVLIAPAPTSGRFRVRWRTAGVHGQAGAEVERHGVTITEAETLLFACLPRIEQYDFDVVPMASWSWAEHQAAADRMARSDLWVADRRGTISVRLQIPVGEA